MRAAAQPRQPQGRRQGLRQPVGAARRHARRRRGRPHRRRRAQRRRQVDAAAPARRHRGARRRRGRPQASGLDVAVIGQGDDLDSARTIREELVGDRADHEWAADARFRSVLDGLLGGVGCAASRRASTRRSRRCPAASGGGSRSPSCCWTTPDLLLLDEPTNHLDVEGVDWLARHLAARRGALVVVTHDRWFLDAVCTHTWEVADGGVHQYDGGYAAYVLARAERDRQEAAREDRRRQLLRKELAWLRRGPPARTSKPKFRIEAANALIADEPAPRDARRAAALRRPRAWATPCSTPRTSRSPSASARCCAPATWRLGARRPRRARRRQRLGQDDAGEPAGRRARAGRRGGRARARRCGWPTSPRTPPSSRGRQHCGCSSRWSRCAGASASATARS